MTDSALKPRITSIDWLRGLVMVLMLIDHTRDFIHAESYWHNPTDLSIISSATFLTRWITHFCAPVFVFLAGLSISLQIQSGKSLASVRRFLWTRGLWLVFCEFTLVRIGKDFDLNFKEYLGMVQVIWALGISMLIMAAIIHFPRKWIFIFGLGLVLGHNLLDPIQAVVWKGPGTAFPGLFGSIWLLLHQTGSILPFGAKGPLLYVSYPLLPWPGVMALGFALGHAFEATSLDRKRLLSRIGLACIVFFIFLRLMNVYGNPAQWSHQSTFFRTILSFINTTKYPPSLLFLLMTLGPALIVLAWREGRTDGFVGQALVTFGRVPMFFYLLQWPAARCLAILFSFAAGKPWRFLVAPADGYPPPNSGFSLLGLYSAWLLGLIIFFPICRWFANLKSRRTDWWLSYL